MSEALGAARAADLGAARAVALAVARRASAEAIEIAGGCVLRHPRLAHVYHLNAVHLRAPLTPDPGADELVTLADRWLDGLAHRRLVLDDAPAAERLTGELTGAGWERERTLYMVLRAEPSSALIDSRARAVTEDELYAAELVTLAQDDFGPNTFPGLIERLADAQAAARAGTTALRFGAGDGDEIASHCTLFCDTGPGDRRWALIDNVGTLREHRGQGLAKAAVSAAIRAAGEWGADLLAVPADADDWPQLLYAGLGFGPVGQQVTFTRRDGSG